MLVDAACRWAWVMAFLSTAALEIAADDGDSPLRVTLTVIGMIIAVVAGNLVVRQWLSGWTSSGNRLTWILSLAGIAFGLELSVRLAAGAMWPLEMLLLLAGFRNAVLALALFAHESRSQRSCCVLSTFLMIFSSAVTSQIWLQGVVILFAVIGIWWLMESYWNSLTHRLVATSSRGLSRRWMLLLPLLLAGCLLAIPFGGESLRAMSGFMPSSGGTDWYSEAARSGVGDGDALIAGTKDIRSFAPIEDAPFLSSHEPSLYDLFDDAYDEPVKVSAHDRAIAIPKEMGAQQKEHHLAQSQQAGRQFSTLREVQNQKKGKIRDRKSGALLYVKGRTPLHLKLQAYQAYDGIEWFPDTLTGHEPKHRRAPRVEFVKEVKIVYASADGQEWKARKVQGRNISRTGMAIIDDGSSLSDKVVVFRDQPGGVPMLLSGKVVRRVPVRDEWHEYGIEFIRRIPELPRFPAQKTS